MSEPVTLKENRDFKRLYKQAQSFVGPALVIYVKENRAGFCRLGITTSKKIGGAVERNRARRVIRVAYRAVSPLFNKSFDIVIVARKRATFLKSQDIERELHRLLKQAGVID